MRAVMIGIGSLVGVLALTWVFTGNDFFLYQYFAPKRAVVERKVFEGTPSYVRGNIQELQKMRRDYLLADKEHQAALRDVIISTVDGIDQSQLPADLIAWVETLRTGDVK